MTKEDKNTTEKMTVAEQIWQEIKDRHINLFSLPGQTIERHCTPVKVDPSKLYLTSNVPAILPALEVALGSVYSVERVNKYITVSKN